MWRHLFYEPVVGDSLHNILRAASSRQASTSSTNPFATRHQQQQQGTGAEGEIDNLWKLIAAIEQQQQQQKQTAPTKPPTKPVQPANAAADTPSQTEIPDLETSMSILRQLFGGCSDTEEPGSAQNQAQAKGTDKCTASNQFNKEVLEDETSYAIVMDVAGAKKDNIKVTYTDRVLRVEFERRRPAETMGMQLVTSNMDGPGRYVHSLRLNRGAPYVPAGCITAKLTDGLLVVRVPKATSPHIPVTSVDVGIE